MVLKILEQIDILGIKFHLYTGKNIKRRTPFGGILTILLVLLSILFFLIFGNNFFNRKNPTITMSIENNLKYDFLNFKKEQLLFAFRIEDYDAHFIDVTNILYFKIYYYTTEQGENGEYHSKIRDDFLPYHICNDSDFPDINLTKTYGKLFCPEFGENKFGGYWDSPNLYYFEIQVFFCENGTHYSSNNKKCTSLNTLREFLNQDHPKFFAFYYPLIEFNPLSYNQPLVRRYKNLYYCLSYNLQRNDDIFLKKTIFNDDKGWLFNTNKNLSKWGVDSIKSTYAYFSDQDLIKDGSSTKIYEINLYSTMEKNYYTRYYVKLQNVIAITGSIINIFVYLFEAISHFVGENIQKLEIIQNTFEYNDNKCKKIRSIKEYSHQGTDINLKHLYTNEFNDIQSKLDCSIKKTNNKKQVSLFNLDLNENENYNKKIKIVNNNLSNSKNDNFCLINNNVHNNIEKIADEKSGENLILRVKSAKSFTTNVHSYINKNEELSLGYMIKENLKMNLMFCCFTKKKFAKTFNTKNSNLFHWYYIYLIQLHRYLEMLKQFEFIKKLLLNYGQINSLFFLKKINLKNEDEKENLITIKNNNVENSVVNYFKNVIRNINISKTDSFIYENLSENIKNKII